MSGTYHNIIQTGGGAGGGVSSVVAGDGIVVDSTDTSNPIVSLNPNLLTSSVTFYSTTTASSIGGYNKLVTSIESTDYDKPAVNVSTGAITGSDQLVGQLATDAGIFVGNPGIITITTIGEIRKVSGSANAQFYFKVFHRNAGGTETEIAVSNPTAQITGSTYSQFNASALLNNGAFDSTDRVVIKYYASRVGGGSNPTYEFSFGGDNPVRTLFPLPTEILLTNYYTKTETDNKISTTWEYLAYNAKTDGVEISITGGTYLVYTINSTTIYRFISTAIDANGYNVEDSFYSTLTSGTLSNLIVTRG